MCHETLKWLDFDHREDVNKYIGYDVNECIFWTKGEDKFHLFWQDINISILASSTFYMSVKDR